MYIIKNAIANLKRNKGRNLLLGIIFYGIITLISISIIINTAAGAVIKDYTSRFGSEITLETEAHVINGEAVKPLSAELLLSFSDSKYLQSKQLTAKAGYVPVGFKPLDQDASQGEDALQGYLIGSSRKDINDAFKNGLKNIVSGTMFNEKNEVIISKKLAEQNSLKPGDTISLKGNSAGDSMKQVYTISGIYEDVSLGKTNSYPSALNNADNEIYGSFETVKTTEIFKSYGIIDSKFFLNNPDDLEAFQKELTSKGLPSHYKVSTNEAAYNQIVKPVENIQNMAQSITIGTLVLGSIILVLLSTFAIRERKYEVGVLRAMGMKKGKIANGLLCEITAITMICLILGLGSAAVSAAPIKDVLLSEQIALAKETAEKEGTTSSLDNVDVNLTHENIAKITLIAVFIGAVSSIGGIMFITRYEPVKILSERN